MIAARLAFVAVLFPVSLVHAAETPAARPREDASGNPIRYAATGHVSNYDEAKVGTYRLPDPLVLRNGQPVRDAKTWSEVRRPEILQAYEQEVAASKLPGYRPAMDSGLREKLYAGWKKAVSRSLNWED